MIGLEEHLQRLKDAGNRGARVGRRLYEAERELFVYAGALTLILILVFSVSALAWPLDGAKLGRVASLSPKLRIAPPAKSPAETEKETGHGAQAADEEQAHAQTPDPQPAGGPPADQQQPEPPQPPPPPAKPPLPALANAESLDPTLVQRFVAFRQFVYDNFGQVLTIRSGYRSTAEQAYLYRTLPRGQANPPGRSNHEKGQAIDYAPYGPQFNQYLSRFGLKLPYAPKEQWHVEIVEPH